MGGAVDLLGEEDATLLEETVKTNIEWLEANQSLDAEEYDSKYNELETVLEPLLQKLKTGKQAGVPNPMAGAGMPDMSNITPEQKAQFANMMGGAGGGEMPDLSNITPEQKAQFASMMSGMGGEGGGMPDLASMMSGMGGAGGMPDLASMMSGMGGAGNDTNQEPESEPCIQEVD